MGLFRNLFPKDKPIFKNGRQYRTANAYKNARQIAFDQHGPADSIKLEPQKGDAAEAIYLTAFEADENRFRFYVHLVYENGLSGMLLGITEDSMTYDDVRKFFTSWENAARQAGVQAVPIPAHHLEKFKPLPADEAKPGPNPPEPR